MILYERLNHFLLTNRTVNLYKSGVIFRVKLIVLLYYFFHFFWYFLIRIFFLQINYRFVQLFFERLPERSIKVVWLLMFQLSPSSFAVSKVLRSAVLLVHLGIGVHGQDVLHDVERFGGEYLGYLLKNLVFGLACIDVNHFFLIFLLQRNIIDLESRISYIEFLIIVTWQNSKSVPLSK